MFRRLARSDPQPLPKTNTLCPECTVQRSVLNGFSDVLGLEGGDVFQVGNRAARAVFGSARPGRTMRIGRPPARSKAISSRSMYCGVGMRSHRWLSLIGFAFPKTQ